MASLLTVDVMNLLVSTSFVAALLIPMRSQTISTKCFTGCLLQSGKGIIQVLQMIDAYCAPTAVLPRLATAQSQSCT
jgi:hypothetical protein